MEWAVSNSPYSKVIETDTLMLWADEVQQYMNLEGDDDLKGILMKKLFNLETTYSKIGDEGGMMYATDFEINNVLFIEGIDLVNRKEKPMEPYAKQRSIST